MVGAARIFSFPNLLSALVLLLGLFGCSASQPPKQTSTPSPTTAASERPIFTPPAETVAPAIIKPAPIFPVMLGIDVLEADGFAALRGKRIGLLTHPAGVPLDQALRRASLFLATSVRDAF